jgi:drug/metabolite transporter (DMT)-like permease
MDNRMAIYLGIGLMISAMALFALKDGLAKVLLGDISTGQVIWLQYVFTFVIIWAITAPRYGMMVFALKPLHWQLMRGLSSFGAIGMFYWSLTLIPLADATAMAISAPLAVAALSPVMLGETTGPRRVVAMIVGFIGVLVILRPGFSGVPAGYLIALGSGALFGLGHIGNRRVGRLHPPLVNIAHHVLPGTALLLPLMPFIWRDLPPAQWLVLAGFLVISLFGHGMMVSAFRFAPAVVIGPYQYTVIIFAAAVGYFAFGTFPDLATWAGIALIIAGGVFIALREGADDLPNA